MDEKTPAGPDTIDLIEAAIHAAGRGQYGGHVNQQRLVELLREAQSVAIAVSEAAALRKNVENLFVMFRELEDRLNALDGDRDSDRPSETVSEEFQCRFVDLRDHPEVKRIGVGLDVSFGQPSVTVTGILSSGAHVVLAHVPKGFDSGPSIDELGRRLKQAQFDLLKTMSNRSAA